MNKHRKYLSHMVLGLQDKSKIVRWLGPSGGGAQTSRVHPSHNQKVLVWITTSHPTMSCKCAPVGKTSAASCPVTWTRTDLNKCAPEWGMYLGIPAFQVFCFASSHNFGIITWKGKKEKKKINEMFQRNSSTFLYANKITLNAVWAFTVSAWLTGCAWIYLRLSESRSCQSKMLKPQPEQK